MSFLIFCNGMFVNKSRRVPPFTFFGTMRLLLKEFFFQKFQFFSKKSVLRFLSLRYGADFRRSRLVSLTALTRQPCLQGILPRILNTYTLKINVGSPLNRLVLLLPISISHLASGNHAQNEFTLRKNYANVVSHGHIQ